LADPEDGMTILKLDNDYFFPWDKRKDVIIRTHTNYEKTILTFFEYQKCFFFIWSFSLFFSTNA
jgi:hypothetical protein